MFNCSTISIAMTTYNGERFLQEQLDSFLGQTRLPDELVVCDDGSSDATLDILHNFACQAPFPVHIHCNEKNLGYARNFEKAASLCTQDIIFFSDQDDVWLPHKLEKMSLVFEQYPEVGMVFSDAFVSDCYLTYLGYSVYDQIPVKRYIDKILKPGEFTYFFFRKLSLLGCLTAINMKLCNELLPIPAYWSHDNWIPLAASIKKSVACISDKLFHYRQHDQQLYGIMKKNIIYGIINIINIDFYQLKMRYLFNKMLWLEGLVRLFRVDNNSNIHNIIITYLKHIDNRYNLILPLSDRIKIVFKEYLEGNYNIFSNGIISFIYDNYIYFFLHLLSPKSGSVFIKR